MYDVEVENKEVSSKLDQKRFSILGVEVVYLVILGIATAFLGWVIENTGKAITSGIIDSRFHVLPFISPYALVPFAVHIVLGSPDDIAVFGKHLFKQKNKNTIFWSNIISIIIICCTVFLGELAVGNFWYLCFGVELWNYSNLPFQVTQYAGLLPSLGYGMGAYLLFKFVYTPALNYLREKADYEVAKKFAVIIGSLIVLDTLVMALHIIVLGEAPILWRIYLR